MVELRLYLLGNPRLERNNQPITITRRKALALLAYLAATRQPHSRDELATLFWPDQDQSGARASLRRDLSTLKRTLGDHALIADQAQIGFNPEANVWIDAEDFEARATLLQSHDHDQQTLCAECVDAVTEAVELYVGDFMAGFNLPDSSAFDEWQFFETERLRQLLAQALQYLSRWHIDRDEYERAITHARRWLALDPLHEAAHRQLMQLYAWAGQQSAALRQYQECVRLLKEELNVPPDEATIKLYEVIRTKQLAPPHTKRVDRSPPEDIAAASIALSSLPPVGLTSAAEQQIRFCATPDGVRLAYALLGDGPPLIKAANWLSHLEYDWESPIWRHWLIGLAQQHTLIRYDERGCGLSDWDVADISFGAWVRDLETVIDAAHIERFPLIGISKGGATAIAYAARHPERVSHLILYGAYARGRLIRNSRPQAVDEARLMTDLIRLGWGQETPAFRQVFASTFMPDGTAEQYRWFDELERASASPENAARIYAGSNHTDVRALAEQLRVPTLVLHARGDMRIPLAEGRLLASLIPGAQLITLDSNNHILLEHEPAWQKFLQEVQRFLADTPKHSSVFSLPALSQTIPSGTEDRSEPRHNLPPEVTSFIGRKKELAEIRSLLIDDPDCRLLTLLGPGGSGKTRLAMAVVNEVSGSFQHGARFVSLAAVNSHEMILYTVAEALGVKIAGAGTQLTDFLRDRQLLLVLDNFEHVIDGVAVINDLLTAAPELKIMTTSRERLKLRAEHVIKLAGLSFPERDNTDARNYEAVELFVRRAASVRGDFTLTAANLRTAARICRLVEGLPLALELAVRWLRVLSLEEIATEIERGLDVLAADTRDVPDRQRSIRAVFDYSWQLLSPEEQLVLRRLSVFHGGFRREAATEVAGATLLILASLVDKSLLNRTSDGRYYRHPLIAQYTREKLAVQPAEQAQVRQAHAATYFRVMQQWGQELRGGKQKEALHIIEEELDNIHAALRWAVAEQQIDLLRESWDTIDEFYLQRQRLPEGIEVMTQIIGDLDQANPAHFPVLGRALVVQSHFYYRLDRYDESLELAQRGLPLLQAAGDARGTMKGLNMLGITALALGDYATARSYLQQALDLAETHHEAGLQANYLNNLAMLETTSGNYSAAEQYYRQALALNQQRGNHLSRVRNLKNLGELLCLQKRWPEAQAVLQEGLTLSREMGFTVVTGHLLTALADVALARQDIVQAQTLYNEALHIAQESGVRAIESEAVRGLKCVAVAQDNFAEAQRQAQLALQLAADTHSARQMLDALIDLVPLLIHAGKRIQAAELLALIDHHPASVWQTREAAHRQLAELETAIPHDQFAAATTHDQLADVPMIVQRLIKELTDPNWHQPPGPTHQLPPQTKPFIGREKELAEIQALITEEAACRLLTLIGPGGIGKTRLSLEAAARAAGAFQAGAALIELASLGTSDLILPALAEALNVSLSGAIEPKEQLLNYLRGKHLLLVFDNFEHLAAGAGLLSDLLVAASHLKIIVTSRERLNVKEEWAYEVPGMTFPPDSEPHTNNEAVALEAYSAVQLFIRCARQAVANFAPAPTDMQAIARICRLVDGSPLAIELAAAWVNVLDCAAIADEVQRGLDVLTTRQRDMPEHHRSMRVVFDRAWARLTDDEGRVFQQLSVFRGGFRRAAAEQVAGASLAILSALANKSLLHWDPIGRYQIHELLRQYAEQHLAAVPDDEARSHDRHCAFYATFLKADFQRILDGQQLEVAQSVEAEIGNIRAAWSRALAQRDVQFIDAAVPALWPYYQYRCRYLEGASILAKALDCLLTLPTTEVIDRSRALTQVSLAWLYIRLGRIDEAEECLTAAMTIYEQRQLPPAIGVATDPRVALGIIASIRGSYADMVRLGEEAVRLSEEHAHYWNRPYAFYLLTRAALVQGDYDRAQSYAQQASAAAQHTRDRWFLAYCLIELGNVALARDEFDQAREHFQASYDIRREFEDREGMAIALNRLGTVAYRREHIAESRTAYRQSLDLYRELDDQGGLASTHNGLGFVAVAEADYATAAQHFQQALRITHELDFAPLTLWVLLGIGEMFLKTGQVDRGVELVSMVVHHPASEREASRRAQHCLDRFQDRLPPDRFAVIYRSGRQLELDHVATRLLTDLANEVIW